MTRSPPPTVVTLSASADPGCTFSGWSDGVVSTANPVTATIMGDTNVTATFEYVIYLPLILTH
jgi:hypothetical protein